MTSRLRMICRHTVRICATCVFFLSNGGVSTLILIDEFGGGTEPQIGGAIAQALLKEFNRKEMWGIVTTHYQNP